VIARGQLLLHYRILAELGQGGMGQVFRARDERLGREVALKMLPADLASDANFQARLMREARAAGALNHPGIVTLFDIESHEGRTFLVMELVEGDSFSKLATQRIEWKRAVTLVAGVAEALAAAHARGILHRDIKSDNLMVLPSGQPKVLDFGLAKLRDANQPGVDPENGITARMTKGQELSLRSVGIAQTVRPVGAVGTPVGVTRAGQLLGTPAYMAPECFEGTADAKSEIFSLGVVLYELLAGVRPFERAGELQMMSAIMLDDPQPISQVALDRTISPALDAVIAKALAKKPSDRYADMTTLAAALRETLVEKPAPAPAPPPRPVEPVAPAVPRWWYVAGTGAVLAIALGGWFVLRTMGEKPPTQPVVAAPADAVAAPVAIEVTSSRRLTLEPGCEEYPRQHPDGKRVVYDGIVDNDYEIQVLDLDTSEKKRLTTLPGWDYASALSPDGSQVAFVHEDIAGRTLRLVPVDGSAPPRDLGAIVGYPAWTHDGALLVGDTSGRILRRDVMTNKDTVLGSLPAGARLYHLVEVKNAGIALMWWTSSDADATSLGELDRDGTLRVIEEMATDYEGGLSDAGASRGYYATRKGATEGNQLLYRAWGGSKPVAVPGVSPGAGIDVRADGKRLVFSTCVEREYIVRIAGDQATEVSRGAWQDTNPHIVDGKRIVITSNRLGQAQGWLLDLDGKSPPRAITPAGSLGSTASRDGKLVAYATRTGLGIIDVAGGAPRILTSDASDAAPAFTHDSKHLVFERTVKGVTHIFTVPVTGGEPRSLFVGEAPAPSPTSDALVYLTTADAAGTRRVMTTTLEGSEPTPIVNIEPATWHRPKYSPDGKQLLLVRGYQQLVAATLDGKTPPKIVWMTTAGSVNSATWTRDGVSIIAAVGGYEGDLWLADGVFP